MNARIQRMIREIESDPAFKLFDTLFGAIDAAIVLGRRIATRRRYIIPLLAD